jgi:hypothetical protein
MITMAGGIAGRWAALRATGSTPTGPRCCRLSPVQPVVGWRSSVRLPRDHYVRVDSNDYSVSPEEIGRRIEVLTDLDRVRAFCDGRPVADHARVWARRQTITDAAHRKAAIRLRRERLQVVQPPGRPSRTSSVSDGWDRENRRVWPPTGTLLAAENSYTAAALKGKLHHHYYHPSEGVTRFGFAEPVSFVCRGTDNTCAE